MAERLLNRRNELNLSREQVAAMSGVGERTLVNYEKGSRQPRASDILQLAKALRTTGSYLLGETDDPSPDALKRPELTPEEEALPFHARRGSGELIPPEEMESAHRQLLIEYYEAKERRLKLQLGIKDDPDKQGQFDPPVRGGGS